MRTCSVCGEHNSERARYCSACGEALDTPSSKRFRRMVTVLFSDLVDSTGLGERLDPEALSHVMSEYLEAVEPILGRHGGTLAKFIGDAVMAVFGLTELHEDDALRAARAALEMRETLTSLDDRFQQRYGVILTTRTGIHTGLVAGTVLAPDRGLMVGDTSNTAARLQQTAPPGDIVVSDATYRLLRGTITVAPIPPVTVKGKAEPLRAYRLVSVTDGSDHSSRLMAPLVGRQDALAQLEWAFERSISEGRCRMVTVVGAPGVGKSRLTQEFVTRAGDRATVLTGRCLPYGDGITFWPLAKMVKQAAGIAEEDAAAVAVQKLEALLRPDDDARSIADTIARLTGLLETHAAVEEGFWAVRVFFTRLAAARPVIAVIDDAHWAEPTFLALLEHVGRMSTAVPLLLLCITRPDLFERRPEWGTKVPGSRLVKLDPLDEAACDRLIALLLGEVESALDLRDRIAETAEGNPLFIEQMISMLIDDGVLEKRDDRWEAVRDVASVKVPPGIYALLAARLERLGPDERAVLGHAAVMGQIFYVGAIEALASPPLSERIRTGLLELVRKELIRPRRSDFVDEEAFEFHHLLIRDAAYDALSKEDRADLHARFADWLEGVTGSHEAEYAEIIGWHLEQAHRFLSEIGALDSREELARRAADRLADAGWTASARGDVSAGVTLRSRALALMPSGDERRLPLLADLGDALLWGGRFDDADTALAEAVELAGRAADERTGVRARLSQLRLRFQVDAEADYAELEREALTTAEQCTTIGDDFGAARAWRVVYWARWGQCQLERMRPAAEQAYEHDRRAKDPHYPQDDLIGVLVSMVWGPTPATRALAEGEEILRKVQGHRGAEAYASCFLGQLRGMLGQREAAREMILKGVAERQELGDRPGAAMSRGEGLGYFVEMVRGDWVSAERELRIGFDELAAMGDKNYLAVTAGWLAHCVYAQARWGEADELAGVCERSAATSWAAAQVLWRGARAMVLARRGLSDAAESLAREGLELALRTDRVDTQTDALLDLAEVLRMAGRTVDAVPLVTQALRRYEAKEVLPAAARARALLDELAPTPA